MKIIRKEDLSIYYWLVDLFSDHDFIKIEDGFPDKPLTIPSISVEPDIIDIENNELGNRSGARFRTWYIDVFAKNKAQRNEFAYEILDALKDGITIYDYDIEIPSSVAIGHLNILKRRLKVVRIEPELVSKMYYRSTISILATNDIL